MIQNKDVLNFLIKELDLSSYLEIGVRNCNTFEHVECNEKISADKKFDLIFIDGDHSFDFVKRDLENSLLHVSEKGLIVLHDTDPPLEKFQGPPKLSGGAGSKCLASPMGECWKVLVERRIKNQDVSVVTVKCDEKSFSVKETEGSGCESGISICRIFPDSSLKKYSDELIDWNFLESNRIEILNRVSFEEFKEAYKGFLGF